MQVSADEFAEKMKAEGASFPVTGSVFPKEGGKFDGQGTISRVGDRFCLHLTFPPGREPPHAKHGIYTREDFWRFEGVIADNLQAVVEYLDFGGTRHWSNGITSQEYDVDTLLLPTADFDNLKIPAIEQQADGLQKKVGTNNGDVPEDIDTSSKASARATETWMHALVLDFPLIHTNARTEFIEQNDFLGESRESAADTFSGQFDGIEYGLVQRGKDLNVYLFLATSTDEVAPIAMQEQFLTAFLTGLAFATGQHCWPYRVVIRQNGTKCLDKVRPFRAFYRSSLAPFSERIGFNAAVGSIEWNFSDFLGKATHFFNRHNALSEAASKALWLLRSSGAKGNPGEITLISLCVLLESLAVLIFDEIKLTSNADVTSFEEARKEVTGWLDKHPRKSETGFARLRSRVNSSEALRPTDKYRAVCDHFGLKWEGLMKEAWNTWHSVRHKAVHSVLAPDKEDSAEGHFTAVGRISGAINILILRLIGYSGIARTSVYEEKHQMI
jgi:hypothetical protein